jgi:hypothetical protein
VAAFCLSAAAPSALLKQGRFTWVSVPGLCASGVGCLLVVSLTWATPDSDAFWKAAGIVSILAFAAFIASFIFLPESKGAFQRKVSCVAVGATGLAALLSIAGIVGGLWIPAYYWVMVILVNFAFGWGLVAAILAPKRPTTTS